MLPEYRLTSLAAISRSRGLLLRRCLAPSLVLASSLWLVWPRFFLKTPSLIDDWFSISYSGRALHALLHAGYSPTTVDFAGRYRPAYTAVWNYLQWHLLGAPSMATAGLWEVARISAFLVAVALLAALVVGGQARLTRPLVWLAPFAVVMTPGIAVDLARYGPADPIMFGGIVIGLGLSVVGIRMLLAGGDRWRRVSGAGALTIGYLAYLMGVYAKEVSVCLALLLPFVAIWLARRLPSQRRRVLIANPLLWLFVGLLLIPLVHVGMEVATAHLSGRTPYPVEVVAKQNSAAYAAISPLFGAPGALGTYLWTVGVVVALAVLAALIRQRNPDAWLVGGMLLTGWLMTVFQLSDGQTPSRYYIPWIVAVGAVAIRGLASADRPVRIAATVAVCAVAPLGAHHALRHWVQSEERGATAVDLAASVTNAQCRLYVANFDVERRVAIPRLLGFASPEPVSRCAVGSAAAYALTWAQKSLPVVLKSNCASSWQLAEERSGVSLFRCATFTGSGIPNQDAASGDPQSAVVRLQVPAHEPTPSILFQNKPSAVR